MKKALIIEDEPFAQDELKRLLKRLGQVEVIACLESVKESVAWLEKELHPDLIFLDIQLADGLSFEIFEQVNIQVPVIFTTAYDEYAIKAFSLNSIDYLLKPIEEEALRKAVKKWDSLNAPALDWQILKAALAPQKEQYKKRFLSKRGDRLLKIETSEIAFFRAENDLVWLSNREGKEFIIDESLERIEEQLDPSEFFRISRSCIVASSSVVQAHRYFNGRLKLDVNVPTDQELIVSRSKCQEFLKWLEL